MKIFDCFAFFNEMELLELRLQELDPVVDHFVLVEATRTFTKQPKPLFYQENKARFAKYAHKIIHIVVDQYPGFFAKFRVPTAWDYDNYQKEQILKGLGPAALDDWIIVSDLDEIPKREKILELKNKPGVYVFRQKMFFYYLNCWIKDYQEPIEMYKDYKPWQGTVMLRFADLKKEKTIKNVRILRGKKPPQVQFVEEGGWHFSYIGGVERVVQKIEAYAHTEVNKDHFKVKEKMIELMNSGQDLFGRKVTSQIVPIDASFPVGLREQPEKWASLMLRV